MSMTFFTNLFSPDTYETFSRSNRDVSGFSKHQLAWARRVHRGDRFICDMTKLSRWVRVLEVLGECYPDDTPLFYPEGNPYVIRFKVRPVVWLQKDQTIPIREKHIWHRLSFTKGVTQNSPAWTGKVRISLNKLSDDDGQFLQDQLLAQVCRGAGVSGIGRTAPRDSERPSLLRTVASSTWGPTRSRTASGGRSAASAARPAPTTGPCSR